MPVQKTAFVNLKHNSVAEAIVKNTFLEVQDDDEDAPKLRLVHTAGGRDSPVAAPIILMPSANHPGICLRRFTASAEAAGRLDSMGGLPSNPSFETLM